MKKTIKLLGLIAFVVIIGLLMAACTGGGSGGGKSINNADDLKAYLDKQPANSPDNPIKVAMKLNEQMVENVKEAINAAGKYVSLNLTGSPLTTIPYDAFSGCKSLVGITIPNSVTEISGGAFSGTGLTSITIPDSVTSISYQGFSGCTSLTSVTIPNSVTKIEGGAFGFCSGLTNITIPASVTSIGSSAFYSCTSLTSVTFQGTITSNNFSRGETNRGILVYPTFPGNLRDQYLATNGGIGTYIKLSSTGEWEKQ